VKNYFRDTAEGITLAYMRGIRKKVTLNWALGSLRSILKKRQLTYSKIQEIISEIKANPSLYLLDKFPEREERLNEIEEKLGNL
jgi:hypothetical protein